MLTINYPDMLCRFENHLSQRALALYDFNYRIDAYHPNDLDHCFKAIQEAQNANKWVALILEYELGEWWQFSANASTSKTPKLSALVFDRHQYEPCWPAHSIPLRISTPTVNQALSSYLSEIERIRQAISQGDFYQINYTLGFNFNTQASPQDLFRFLAHQHPVGFAAYIDDPLQQRHLLSFSPELFLQKKAQRIVTRPMKGTAPRHSDPSEDQRLAQALLHSDKNRSENLMIVDLLRNDLGKIAEIGSVKVNELFHLEQYPSVWTLISEIEATLPHNCSLQEILSALFPCGSITGAPKHAAMQHIKRHEVEPRGPYCGSIGWLAPNGDFCLNVAIRTLVLNHLGQARYGAGGGIVYDSVAHDEWQECLWKRRILDSLEHTS